MIRALVVVLLVAATSGCSTMSSWFSGLLGEEDNAAPPTPLQDINTQVHLSKRWSTDTGVGYDGYNLNLLPGVAGGRLFVADREGRVTALDALTGKKLWQVRTEMTISAGPGTGEGLVLVGTSNAEVLALDAVDGSERWRATVSSEVLAVPQTDLDKVIVQTADGNVTALDAASGQQLWVHDRSVPVLTLRGTSTPAVEQGIVVAGFSNGKLVALTADRGLVAWQASIAIPQGRSELERIVDIDGDPVIADGAVYVTTFQGRVAVVDLRTGDLGWTRDMSSHAGLGVDYSQVYVTDEDSNVWALSRNTGAAEWKLDGLANRQLTAPEPFADYVAVADFEGYIHLLSRHDGHLAARAKVDDKGVRAKPLVVDEVLYVYGNSGNLAAFTLDK
jgi:outer membrane protein assembly factor BamB